MLGEWQELDKAEDLAEPVGPGCVDPVGRELLNGARWASDCGWEFHSAQCGRKPLGRPASA